MERTTLRLYEPAQAHKALAELWRIIKPELMAGQRIHIEARNETRSLEQNARMWAMLTACAYQVDWYGQKLTPDEWKDVFSAALKRQKVVPGLDGGFVVLGSRTSRMTKAEMSELQELMTAFMAERGVQFFGEDEHE